MQATAALNFDLYDQQFDFVTADEHYLAFVGGIGSGKSRAGAARGILAAHGQIGETAIPVPNVGVVTAPTYPMLRDATIATYLELADPLIAKHNKTEHEILFRNGSKILFRSTDQPDRLRGPNVLWWHGDEAAMYLADTWKIMIGRLRQFGMHGWAWLTTTPKGRNWVWQRFVQHKRDSFRLIRALTLANPFLALEFVEALQEEYAGDFARQELEGEFVAFEGLIYPEFDRDRHVTTKMPAQFKQVVGGIDHGFNHPGVILVGGVDYDGVLHVVHEEYARHRRIEEWVDVAKQVRDLWGVERFFCDPSEPDYIQKYKDAGLKAEAADNAVNSGIQAVKKRLAVGKSGRPRMVVHPACANLIIEFEQYQWAANKEGFIDKPLKTNDHAADALRYLTMGIDEGKPRARVSVETRKYA